MQCSFAGVPPSKQRFVIESILTQRNVSIMEGN